MPEAIATTKRKFYKALDSLHSPPATRPVVEGPTAKRVRRSTSTTSTISFAPATPATAERPSPSSKKLPNFSPWSQETFLARLKTFSSVSLWHPKPEAINEVAWAKRGWICIDVNTVACRGGCERRIVVDLDMTKEEGTTDGLQEHEDLVETQQQEEEETLESALVGRYKGFVAEGHALTCMWRKAGCPDDIYRLHVVRLSIWQPELSRRFDSLRQLSDAIRDIRIEGLGGKDQADAAPFPVDLLGENPDVKCYEIAMHGWRGAVDSNNELLHCDVCFQRVGLWMYQPDYKPSRSASSADNTETSGLDVVELHREHCPWRNPASQKASGSFEGLNASQILMRIVATYARDQRRKSKDHEETLTEADRLETNQGDTMPTRPASPAVSREEVARKDKERESKLKRLKSMFSIKRRTASKPGVEITSKTK
ncbi:hypothetical protein LTR62_003460 [Meristemomyces frigidus]|uniref:Zf-C3HC-domain-containing protein n=1 Tax=Meristemomyces frigidus TaxID=1508187 RepID=A0AAN7TEX4_9PEZI|nr:hypothetical protein LTR62_003460 [Meristemomyces frigidus]